MSCWVWGDPLWCCMYSEPLQFKDVPVCKGVLCIEIYCNIVLVKPVYPLTQHCLQSGSAMSPRLQGFSRDKFKLLAPLCCSPQSRFRSLLHLFILGEPFTIAFLSHSWGWLDPTGFRRTEHAVNVAQITWYLWNLSGLGSNLSYKYFNSRS